MSFLSESHSSLEREFEELEFIEQESSGSVPEWCSPNVALSHEGSKSSYFVETDVMLNEINNHKYKSKNKKQKNKEVHVPSSTKRKDIYREKEVEGEEDDLPVFLREENNNISGSPKNNDGDNSRNNRKPNEECFSLDKQTHSSGNCTADFLADIIEADNSTLPSAHQNLTNKNNRSSTNTLKTSAEELHFVTLRQFEWKLKRIRILGKGSYGCATLYKVELFQILEKKDIDECNVNKRSSSLSSTPTTSVFASILEQEKISPITGSHNSHCVQQQNKLFVENLMAHFTSFPFVVVKDINVQTMQNRSLEMAAIVTEVGIMSHLVQQEQFIQLYDFFELPEQMLYIICEYCSGGDLAALMECVQAKNVSLRQNSHPPPPHHHLYGHRNIKKNNDFTESFIGNNSKDNYNNKAKKSTNTKRANLEEEEEVKSAGPRLLLEKHGLFSCLHSLTKPILQKVSLHPSSTHVLTSKEKPEHENEEYKLYFSEEFIASVLIQLLLALHQLQMEQKVVHRDMKPHNLFIQLSSPPFLHGDEFDKNTDNNKELIIRLADFGVAVQLASSQATISGATGSPFYMAPEVISETNYSFPADVWSLGVVLYELMSLQRPFQSLSSSQLAKCITSNQHIPLHDVEHMKCSFSPELLDLVESLMQINPCARPLPLRLLRSHYVISHLHTLPLTVLVSLCKELPSVAQRLISINSNVLTMTSSSSSINTSSAILLSLFANDVLEKAWEYKEHIIENMQKRKSSQANESTTPNTDSSKEGKNKEDVFNNNKKSNDVDEGNLSQVNKEEYWNEEYADDEFEPEDD